MGGNYNRYQRTIYDRGDGQPETKAKRLMLRLEPSLHDALKDRAAELVEERGSWMAPSVSELIRSYIIEGLERDGMELW